MNYFIKIFSNKPKEDINQIVERLGYKNIAPNIRKNTGFWHFMTKLFSLFKILWNIHKGDMLLIQYPMKKFVTPATWCAHLKGAKVTVLIHDLGCFRRKKLTVSHEMKRMNRMDEIIAHNPSMKQFMEENGCTTPIRCLGIFDYLSDSKPSDYSTPHSPWIVVYAGVLSYKRNSYLYQLDDKIDGWKMELYGRNYEAERGIGWKNMEYKGLLPSDDFIAKVEADFGLVWDGNSLDECSGAWGEYLRVNNPHKTSFYLRAHVPIIIWSKAALAPFIKENNVGIVVDSLKDINSALKNLSESEYALMRKNAAEMGRKLDTGYFTQQALTASTN